MKKYLAVFASFLMITGCNSPETSIQNLRTVSLSEFKTLLQTNHYTLIDIRSPEEQLPENGGKIKENALSINFYDNDFIVQIKTLDKNKNYLMYCRSGNRSLEALYIMEEFGFKNVAELQGGKIAWDKALITPYSESDKMN